MKNLICLSFISLLFACSPKEKSVQNSLPDLPAMQEQLARMAKEDQEIQFAFRPDMSQSQKDSLHQRKGEIFRSNADTLKSWFREYGFLGKDKLDEKASHNFWLMVQHADHDVEFQETFLKAMKVEVLKDNADNQNFAYLEDRVRKNKGLKQKYGTQLEYIEDFWIIPAPLEDSLNVNERREEIGLESIEAYLNSAMELNYQMNKAVYEAQGLKGPRKYELKE